MGGNAGVGGSGANGGSGGSSAGGSSGGPSAGFQLRAEFAGPCARADRVDVDLGNLPEAFVRAAYCQVNGSEPPAETVSHWADQLRTVSWVRRIDVVRSLCNDASRSCSLAYSDPWLVEPEQLTPCVRRGTRDLGAVLMYFNNCPGGVNCGMDWANTHGYGMSDKSPLLGFGSTPAGYYVPTNPGFWRRELVDAGEAGLQFLLLNSYGPDINDDNLNALNQALAVANSPVKIALFDDTWGWGNLGGAFQNAPSLSDAAGAADAIYNAKWKPFFSKVTRSSWYLFNGRPLVYFYNAGTLKPSNRAAAVISGLRSRFQTDFGVSPFIVVDEAFFDDPDMPNQADSKFRWWTLNCDTASSDSCVPGKAMSESTLHGVKLDHFMVKDDSLGRDHAGQIAGPNEGIVKDDSTLKLRLQDSSGAQLADIATWNDLGEGTGIERNYDYYWAGQWQEPITFMKAIRAAQCSN